MDHRVRRGTVSRDIIYKMVNVFWEVACLSLGKDHLPRTHALKYQVLPSYVL